MLLSVPSTVIYLKPAEYFRFNEKRVSHYRANIRLIGFFQASTLFNGVNDNTMSDPSDARISFQDRRLIAIEFPHQFLGSADLVVRRDPGNGRVGNLSDSFTHNALQQPDLFPF
jgi:hypothetical protein